MEWLGDLERAFATNLYPLRVPIGIAMLLGVVALAVVARRRGWLAAAARHPRRAVVLGALAIALVAPTAWYLGSPLFIRTALSEPVPTATGAPGAPSGPAGSPPVSASPAPSGGSDDRSGEFTGADEFHFGSGTARLVETGPGAWVIRFEQFSVRNGPDLFVYLSPDPSGYVPGAVELGRLKATDGDFNTDVPPGTDVAAVRSVVIWCKQFAVQFAVAALG